MSKPQQLVSISPRLVGRQLTQHSTISPPPAIGRKWIGSSIGAPSPFQTLNHWPALNTWPALNGSPRQPSTIGPPTTIRPPPTGPPKVRPQLVRPQLVCPQLVCPQQLASRSTINSWSARNGLSALYNWSALKKTRSPLKMVGPNKMNEPKHFCRQLNQSKTDAWYFTNTLTNMVCKSFSLPHTHT